MNFIKKSYFGTFVCEIREFSQSLNNNSVSAYSAQAAFFVITSFFPFMLLMTTLIKFTPIEMNIQAALSGNVLDAFNPVAGEFLSGIMREISMRAAPGALLGAAGISAIWAASRCLMSVIQGLNRVYSIESKRGWLGLRLTAVIYVFALQAMIIVSLGILVFGERINDWLIIEFNMKGLSDLIIGLRWAVGFLLLTSVFTLVYALVPDHKNSSLRGKGGIAAQIRQCLPGAILSAAGWLGFSWLFSMYIANFADFGAVYGSLAAAVVLMLWLYFCMYILFFGAQFNVYLQGKDICGVKKVNETIKARVRKA